MQGPQASTWSQVVDQNPDICGVLGGNTGASDITAALYAHLRSMHLHTICEANKGLKIETHKDSQTERERQGSSLMPECPKNTPFI